MQRNVYIENMPLEKALTLFINSLQEQGYFAIESEEVDVITSQGRITSKAVSARRSSPHYIASAMDGIAVRASCTAQANEQNPIYLKPAEDFIEVDTGDYVPLPFDAVIMIEDVNFIDGQAQIIKPAVPWQHIRSVGEDLVAHDLLLTSFTPIGPFEIGSMITGGLERVEVVKQPRVAIIPTGTELREKASDDMAPGEIIESNSRMLAALCTEWGAIPLRHALVIDDKELLRQAVRDVKDEADIIVICSGSSAGREDYSSSIIDEYGKVLVHGIAIRPGKPAILGIIDNKPVIGVPGYPISAQLIFHLFARPVIYRKQGLEAPDQEQLACTISRKTASSMGVDEFVYVNVSCIGGHYTAYPLSRGAGITTSLVKADGVLQIPRGKEGLQAGENCMVTLRRPRSLIDKTMVTIGSHDICLDILADILKQSHNLRLVSTNAGSMGGIMALRRGETHFSGIHLLDIDSGDYNTTYLRKYLSDKKWLLVNLAKRQQGLIIKKGNPLRLNSLKDIQNKEIRYINRQPGAGTRILFDYLLAQENLEPSQINGYTREEFTHLAIAAAVKNDAADAGLGIFAAARAMDLDFIPICEERYDLCILPELLSSEWLQILLDIIRGKEFISRAFDFGGYALDISGKIIESNGI